MMAYWCKRTNVRSGACYGTCTHDELQQSEDPEIESQAETIRGDWRNGLGNDLGDKLERAPEADMVRVETDNTGCPENGAELLDKTFTAVNWWFPNPMSDSSPGLPTIDPGIEFV
jgi:hypothetical protein